MMVALDLRQLSQPVDNPCLHTWAAVDLNGQAYIPKHMNNGIWLPHSIKVPTGIRFFDIE